MNVMPVSTYQIAGDKVLIIKVAVRLLVTGEYAEVLGQGNQNAEEQGDVGTSQTEWSGISHLVFGDALCPTCAHEKDVRDEERNPGKETKNGGQVHKVAKDNFSVVSGVHESGAAKER
jgi:hypothetical protein